MKRITFSLLCFMLSTLSWCQGIRFEPEPATLEAAAAKAKGEGKLVFLDCYTQWVKPFMEPTADPAQKAIVRKILEQRIADIDAGKRKAMTQVGNMQLSVSTRDLLQRILTMTMQ